MTAPVVSTYSMWSLFRNCRKAVDWRYIQQLVGLERDGNLHFGTLVHQCLELWQQCRDLGRVLDLIGTLCPNRLYDDGQRRDWHNATALMKAYAARYAAEEFEVVALEKTFQGPIVNPATGAASRSFVLAGKVDGIVRIGDDYFLLEHKTAAQLDADYLERLWTDFQITIYAYYVEQAMGITITGILYNILVKAKLQQSKGETEEEYQARRAELLAKSKTGKTTAKRKLPETDEEFQERLAEKYTDPAMLHREMLYLSRDRFDILRSELWELTQAYLDARRRGVFYQNTGFCFNYHRPCAYFALCRSNGNPNVIENFYQRVAPNEELRVLPNDSTDRRFLKETTQPCRYCRQRKLNRSPTWPTSPCWCTGRRKSGSPPSARKPIVHSSWPPNPGSTPWMSIRCPFSPGRISARHAPRSSKANTRSRR